MKNRYKMNDTKPATISILLVLFLLFCIFSAGCVGPNGSTGMPTIVNVDEYDLYEIYVAVSAALSSTSTTEEKIEALENVRDNQAQLLPTKILIDQYISRLKEGESVSPPDLPAPPKPVLTGPVPGPVDPMSIPESGEFKPDPVSVLYAFYFQDGTQLRFREEHGRDIWGRYPDAGGWGQIIWPDGRKEGIVVNKVIRHEGYIAGNVKTPVTTLSHGRRMFWMADMEERKDVKKVTIFEDGWSPHVEGAVLGVKDSLGITSPLVSCVVKIEKRKQ